MKSPRFVTMIINKGLTVDEGNIVTSYLGRSSSGAKRSEGSQNNISHRLRKLVLPFGEFSHRKTKTFDKPSDEYE